MKIADLPELYSYDILPKEDEEFEAGKTGITWLSKDNIYISVPYKDVEDVSLDDIKSKISTWELEYGTDRKVLLLTIVHPKRQQNREVRKYLSTILPKYVQAQAIVSQSPLAKMIGNLFFKLSPQPYPFKFFSNPEEGILWLKKLSKS